MTKSRYIKTVSAMLAALLVAIAIVLLTVCQERRTALVPERGPEPACENRYENTAPNS